MLYEIMQTDRMGMRTSFNSGWEKVKYRGQKKERVAKIKKITCCCHGLGTERND